MRFPMRSRAARMSASEIISISSSATRTFDFYPLRFHFAARRSMRFPAGETANFLRGRFGKCLHDRSVEIYERFFAPAASEGPSGLRDAPRPFVFRVRHLEGAEIGAGRPFWIGMNLFEMRHDMVDVLRDTLAAATDGEPAGVEGTSLLRLSLEPPERGVSRGRVLFMTPTELKGADRPEFGVLFARIRDRISTLRSLYGAGPLSIDFAAMGERAARVQMTRCELGHVPLERLSRRSGQRHPLGGFVGVAEYQGELAEFVPYLEAARWTGVGRQTVWGKGEIIWEAFGAPVRSGFSSRA